MMMREAQSVGTTFVACGWCRRMVELGTESCPGCGHDAHRSRIDCRCGRAGCRSAEGLPVPFAGLPRADALEVLDEIDGHLYETQQVHCSYCGTHIAEATQRRCGHS